MALNFVTSLDEVMCAAFAHKASLERLAKYRLEGIWGVEEGDTRMAHASVGTRRLVRLTELSMYVALGISLVLVVAGQLWGTTSAGSADDACTVFSMVRDDGDDVP